MHKKAFFCPEIDFAGMEETAIFYDTTVIVKTHSEEKHKTCKISFNFRCWL